MNQPSTTLRGPRIEKFNKLIGFGFTALLLLAMVAYWDTAVSFAADLHHVFHAKLQSHTEAVASDAARYGWTLIAFSFAYGVFHAIGPGHGKAVIATYLGTHKESIAKGVGISMATALFQALVAIALVTLLAKLLQLKFTEIDQLGGDMAIVSYVLVILLGLVLSLSALRRLINLYHARKLEKQIANQHQHHDHDHDHHAHQQHEHTHSNGGCACKHTHVPSKGESWWHTLVVVISIGLRPCSGAILILIYAHLVGVFHYGIAATISMGLGTGLAVSAIALGSQYAQRKLERYMQTHADTRHSVINYAVISIGVRLFGGVVLVLLGWGLYSMALQATPSLHLH